MMRLFLSYSRDDKNYVYELWRALRDRAHHDAWIDQRIVPAQDWWETILKSIETCETFIYLMTPKSVESIYCRAELAYALALNKPILPLMLKNCDYPPDLKKRRIQYSTVNDGDSLGDVLFVIAQALGEIRIEALQGKFPPPIPLPLRPAEPIPARRPEQVTEVFMLAEEAAHAGNFSLAEKLFQQVIDADPQGVGLAAAERLGEIRFERSRSADYLTIVQMVSNPALKKGAAALWRVFVGKYGADYDPNRIAAQLVAPPPIIKPLKPRVLDVLPTPFAWIDIPAGGVTLVPDDWDKENGFYLKQDKTINVAAFTIAKYPVTNAQYQAFVDAPDGYADPKWWDYSPDAQQWRKSNLKPQDRAFAGDDHPRADVTWYESVAFTRWLSAKTGENIRLLAEGEWQHAAQGNDGRAYPWGNDWDGARCNNSVKPFDSNSTTPVTQYEGVGDSPFGVVDMAGNVWEWTATDWQVGNEKLVGTNSRVLRGGSWLNSNTVWFRVAYRGGWVPDVTLNNVGFRCARS